MLLTESKLRKIIAEEYAKLQKEAGDFRYKGRSVVVPQMIGQPQKSTGKVSLYDTIKILNNPNEIQTAIVGYENNNKNTFAQDLAQARRYAADDGRRDLIIALRQF